MKKFTTSLFLVAITLAALGAGARAATFSLDLSVSGTQTINGSLFIQGQAPSGSGGFTRLFAIQNTGTEEGYNYWGSSSQPFNQTGGVGDANLDLGRVPVVTIGGVQYLEFLNDMNEGGGGSASLIDFRIYVHTDSTPTAPDPLSEAILVTTAANLGSLGTLIYAFDGNENNTLNLTNIPSGSGVSDLAFYVPLSYFAGYAVTDDVYTYLSYSSASSGFEEFAISPTATYTFASTLTPEPGTLCGGALVLGLAGSGFLRRRRDKTAT